MLVDTLPFVARTVTVGEQAAILQVAGKDPRVLAEARGWITAHTQASLQDLQKEAGALQHLKDAEFVKKTLGTRTKGASPGE